MKPLKDFVTNIIYFGLESIGRYYSSYRGYVIDNDDPDGMGRIKISVPVITKDIEHPTWAYPKTQLGGSNYGIQVLPLKGDMVWVEFEHGDTRFPYWSFAHRAKDEKPEEFTSPEIYGFKTPKGQTIIIDDSQDEPKIIINHGENKGLVKVVELTQRLNAIENKVNSFLQHYRTHQIVDPISGTAGPLLPANPAPIDIDNTNEEDIRNDLVQH